MSERNNVLILLAVIVAIGFFAQAMQIFQGTDTTTITVSLNNTGNLDTPVQSITYISQSRVDIKSMLDTHIVSGYTDPRYLFNGNYYASRASTSIDPTATTLTEHEVNIVLNYSSFPGLKSDFSDMRFGIADGTNIQYWEEDVVSSTSAKIWQKIPSTSTTVPTYIFGYYGNDIISSGSDGSSTFLNFNDFDAWDASSMNESAGGSKSFSNSILHVTGGSAAWENVGLKYQVAPPVIFEFYGKMDEQNYNSIGISEDSNDGLHTGTYADAVRWQYDSSNKYHSSVIDTSYNLQARTSVVSGWTNFKIVLDGSTNKFYENDVLKYTETVKIPDEAMGIYLAANGATADIYIDYAFARKYTITEPTWAAGGWISETTTAQITPSIITLNSITNTTGIYGSYPIIPASTEQDFTLNGTQNFNYTIDFTPTDLAVTTSSSVLYADRAHTYNAVVTDHNTGTVMPTQPDKVKYRLVGSGNTSVSSKEFVGTSLTLPALQKGTYTLFTSVGWNNIPTWSNEISQSVVLTDAATPAQAVALSAVETLTETTTDTISNETTKDVLMGAPGRIADGWKTMFDTIVTLIKNIIHNVSAVFS